jgi:hypothetical protein
VDSIDLSGVDHFVGAIARHSGNNNSDQSVAATATNPQHQQQPIHNSNSYQFATATETNTQQQHQPIRNM